MKKNIIPILLLLFVISACNEQNPPPGEETGLLALEEGFKDPPVSVRPKGYWDWMNGNFDLDRLTIELEEAKAQGMAGFDFFDIGAVENPDGIVPAGPEFMGDECLEAISHAVKEAERLGMELGLILSSSWDAGGSWIKPEHGSMALYKTSITTEGPGTYDDLLPFPKMPELDNKGEPLLIEKNEDGLPVFYKDVAVLATPVTVSGEIDDISKVINLSSQMEADGKLTWEVPEGKWEITRFVCSNTGEALKCPSPNSSGRSMDHFNPEATDFHFNYFLDRLQDKLGDIGNTPIKYFYLCSYEVVGFVWTPKMLEEFKQRRGYEMIPYLPVLQGKTVQNRDITERFLYDYRQTLSDLLIENLYLRGREIINPYGIKLCSESGGPGAPVHNCPVDALRALGVLDIPRGEFWYKHQRFDEFGFDVMQLVKEISCAAHIYGKKEVQGESFTSFLHWQEGPAELKPLADLAMCEGLNRFIYHTSPHTTPDAGIPGFAYHAGTHFNSTRVWWPKSRAFTDYLARSCFLLQQGNFVGDVLYYYGDQAPNFVKPKHVDPNLGFGYDYDVTNSEVILTRLDVKDGKLVLPDGTSYEILVLPDQDHANPEVMKKLEDLVDRGATIVGPKPNRSHGLKDWEEKDKQVRELADQLWGPTDGKTIAESHYGEGKVFWTKNLEQVLNKRGVGPDFSYIGGSDTIDMDFIHRHTADEEIYFVSNKRYGTETVNCSFRVSGMIPEIWDAVTGAIYNVPLYDDDGTNTTIPMKLDQQGSLFVIFRKQATKEIFVAGNYSAERFNPDELIEINGPWEINFPSGWGAPDQISLPDLISWDKSDDPGVKYFSGIATYSKTITIPEELISEGATIQINLGIVKEVAEVWLNSESLGILWKSPYTIDITNALKPGDNELKVEVANTWNNRLVGDAQLPEDERFTKTNITGPNWQTRIPWKDSPLRESGLIGPVSIQID
jgi:hypothetical protein